MARKQKGLLPRLGSMVVSVIGRSPAEGAATAIYLASPPDVEGISGEYYSRGVHQPLTNKALDTTVARRLWDVSAELVHLTTPQNSKEVA